VIEKTQELLVWSLKHIEKFPRTHRYGLGLRLETRRFRVPRSRSFDVAVLREVGIPAACDVIAARQHGHVADSMTVAPKWFVLTDDEQSPVQLDA
jgi:hypothetical protein